MTLDNLNQLGWGEAGDNIFQMDIRYAMTTLKVLAVVKLQTNTTSARTSPTMFGDPYADSSYLLETITNAASDFLPIMELNEAGFKETSASPSPPIFLAQQGSLHPTDRKCETCRTCMLFLPHVVSLAQYNIGIVCG